MALKYTGGFGKRPGHRFGFSAPASAKKNTSSPASAQLTPQQIAQLGNAWLALNPGKNLPGPIPAGMNVTPASPAVPNPPVQPFATGGDLSNYGDALKSYGDQSAQIDQQLADLQANTQVALHNLQQNYVQNVAGTQDNAAARGIFQSSIKDGALADLAATKAFQESDLNTRLNNAKLFADEAHKRLNDWWANFQNAFNQTKVENASGVDATQPPNQSDATAGSISPAVAAPGAAPAQAAPAAHRPRYTGPRYSLGRPGRPQYRLGGY